MVRGGPCPETLAESLASPICPCSLCLALVRFFSLHLTNIDLWVRHVLGTGDITVNKTDVDPMELT